MGATLHNPYQCGQWQGKLPPGTALVACLKPEQDSQSVAGQLSLPAGPAIRLVSAKFAGAFRLPARRQVAMTDSFQVTKQPQPK